MLDPQVLQGHWNQLKGKIQSRWGQLSDNDVSQFRGNVDDLIGVIQQRTGEGRQAIESYLQDITAGSGRFAGQAAETARQYAHEASEIFRDTAQRATEQYYEGMEGVRNFVRDRPGQALAIGVGVGMLLGLALAVTWRR